MQKFVAEFKLNPQPGTFNFRNIFGTHDRSDAVYNAPRVWYGHQMFNGNTANNDDPESMDLPFIMHADSLISLADVKRYLSSHYNSTEFDPIGTGPVQLKKKYRPISLAKTQESHVLQMRPNQHNIHWLSMGVSAQSIYIPIFAETKDVPRAYKTGGQVYSSLSAYWIFKLTGVLVDAHLKDFIPLLEDTHKRLDISFGKQIKNIDHHISDVKNDKVAEFLTDQTKKMSLEALSAFRELNAVMITKSTDMSLLNFNTDENLGSSSRSTDRKF
ncbi:C69 family dipeptidase [Paucilactobacillus suebicus]|uniref:C69 family dipeptidase n=2 Tax=Paucilactobacillus suebicus TaxID=152335 RepID=UPI0033651BDD